MNGRLAFKSGKSCKISKNISVHFRKNLNNICVMTTYHDINHLTQISLVIIKIKIRRFNSVSLPFNGRLTELMFDKKTFIIIVDKT